MTTDNRLARQVRFIREIDRLKQVRRRTYLTDGSRLENSVEHSWHLALMAMLLAEHANEAVDLIRVLEMVLIHDIVEIDAGDTFAYDETGLKDQAARENAAADRLFGMLPPDQETRFRELWEEFETGETAEARFAEALDRFQPMLHNVVTRGKSWSEHGIRKHQVVEKNRHMKDGAEALWDYIRDRVDILAREGVLPE